MFSIMDFIFNERETRRHLRKEWSNEIQIYLLGYVNYIERVAYRHSKVGQLNIYYYTHYNTKSCVARLLSLSLCVVN